MKQPLHKVNLDEKLTRFDDYWSPRLVGELNGQHVKLVKVKGEFVWHHHVEEDELFLVLKGTLLMRFREREVTVDPGEFIIVPAGVEHQPVAEKEVHILLFEPTSTRNTGNVEDTHTVGELEWV